MPGKFLTPLQAEQLGDDGSADQRGTWALLAPLVYDSEAAARVIVVPKGFVTDFASVPRIPLAFWAAGGIGQKAAVVHDHLYTTHDVDRATADRVFREALSASGIAGWRAWLMYAGVRVGGSGAWDAPGQAQQASPAQELGPMY